MLSQRAKFSFLRPNSIPLCKCPIVVIKNLMPFKSLFPYRYCIVFHLDILTIFSFSLIFNNVTMVFLGIACLLFFPIWSPLGFLICKFMSFTKFRDIGTLFLQIIFWFYSLFSYGLKLPVY